MTTQAIALFRILIGMLDKEAADEMLDAIENKVKSTPSKLDDMVILSIISALRVICGIPDNDV